MCLCTQTNSNNLLILVNPFSGARKQIYEPQIPYDKKKSKPLTFFFAFKQDSNFDIRNGCFTLMDVLL